MPVRGPLIALATSEDYRDLARDDHALVAALQARGASVASVIWSVEERWDVPYDAVVVRSCWDYHRRLGEFLAWLQRRAARGTRVLNPPPLLRWNARKRYLLELAAAGIPTPPTLAGDAADLPALLAQVAELATAHPVWKTVIVKPEVSASAFETVRLSMTGPAGFALDAVRGRYAGDVLVQPFLPEIETEGELSLVFIAGRYSHAVLKRPAAGDFRVQAEHGGTERPVHPPAPAIRRAESILDVARQRQRLSFDEPLYARVDLLAAGDWPLMELELIEPSLFLSSHPPAADRLAEAILRHSGAGGVPTQGAPA